MASDPDYWKKRALRAEDRVNKLTSIIDDVTGLYHNMSLEQCSVCEFIFDGQYILESYCDCRPKNREHIIFLCSVECARKHPRFRDIAWQKRYGNFVVKGCNPRGHVGAVLLHAMTRKELEGLFPWRQ